MNNRKIILLSLHCVSCFIFYCLAMVFFPFVYVVTGEYDIIAYHDSINNMLAQSFIELMKE